MFYFYHAALLPGYGFLLHGNRDRAGRLPYPHICSGGETEPQAQKACGGKREELILACRRLFCSPCIIEKRVSLRSFYDLWIPSITVFFTGHSPILYHKHRFFTALFVLHILMGNKIFSKAICAYWRLLKFKYFRSD